MVARVPVREAQVEPWLIPEQRLGVLERKACRLGISDRELSKIQAIGPYEPQIQERIARLQEWIVNHSNSS